VVDEDLVRYLVESLAIPAGLANRIMGDVVAYYSEPIEEFVRRRHADYRRREVPNAEIYPAIVRELQGRLVAAPEVSERQVRRMIYG
jgi:hypothetical protein